MRFLKSFLVFSIVMLLISGCKSAQNSSTKQAITSPDTSLQETASSTAPAANELSPSISPTPRVQKTPSSSPKPKNAKWIYNRKTHVLTIKGTEEMYAEQTEDWIDNERKFDEHNGIQLNFNERKVKEIVVKPGITVINKGAFAAFRNVKKITLPNTIKKINDYAFYNCQSLQELTIPDKVVSVGKECFFYCRQLRSIHIGKNLRTIGNGSFAGCKNLQSIELSSENKYLETKYGGLYQKKQKCLYFQYQHTKTAEIAPDTKCIGTFAFTYNTPLKEVTIPDSVRRIKGGAFCYCRNLDYVHLSNHSKLYKIDRPYGEMGMYPDDLWYSGSFLHCKKLKELHLPNSLKAIDWDTFSGCKSLTLYLGSQFTNFRKSQIAGVSAIQVSPHNKKFSSKDGVLYDRHKKTLLNYPEYKTDQTFVVSKSVRHIQESAFRANEHIENVFFPKKLKHIGEGAFNGCKKLKNATIPGKQTKIGRSAFLFCRHVVIHAPKHSEAAKFAKKHDRMFEVFRKK